MRPGCSGLSIATESELDSILDEALSSVNDGGSTCLADTLPDLEEIALFQTSGPEEEVEIPLPSNPDEIPLPAEIPNSSSEPKTINQKKSTKSDAFKSPLLPPRPTRLVRDHDQLTLERLHELNTELVKQIDVKINALRARRAAIHTRVLTITSRLRNLEHNAEAVKAKLTPQQANVDAVDTLVSLTSFQKPYFRDFNFRTPYTYHSVSDEKFDGKDYRLNYRHDAFIKSHLRQQAKFNLNLTLSEQVEETTGPLRQKKKRFDRGLIDAEDFFDFAETDSQISKARLSSEVESICSSIAAEPIDPAQVEWEVVAQRLNTTANLAATNTRNDPSREKKVDWAKPHYTVSHVFFSRTGVLLFVVFVDSIQLRK